MSGKKKRRALARYLRVKPGKKFSALAKAHGIACSEHGVPFNVIKRRVAAAISAKAQTSMDDASVDFVLRSALGLSESLFNAEWEKRNPAPKARPSKSTGLLPPFRKLGAPHKDYKRDDGFYESREWRQVRYAALKACGGRCQCCGASAADGALMHVDHIKPRYTHPHLSLELSNLQVLCEDCNLGKGAWDDTDWRHFRSI